MTPECRREDSGVEPHSFTEMFGEVDEMKPASGGSG